jgi:L-asparaginase
MEDVIIISTGGTFNKIYNKFTGNLDIDSTNSSIKTIMKYWLCKYKFINIINKDSLDFTTEDRELLLNTIKKLNYKKIVIIHGTDTIDITAKYLDKANLDKVIVLTGAMVPFSFNSIEATANLAYSLGYIQNLQKGVYIALNGISDTFDKVFKNRELGKFELI